jgi:hypothetical protein
VRPIVNAIKAVAKRVPPIRRVIADRDAHAHANAVATARIKVLEAQFAQLAAENARLGAGLSLLPNAMIERTDLCAAKVLENGFVVAWVPIELCFNEHKEHAYQYADGMTDEWVALHSQWENLPIVRLKPHRDLYRFFLGGEAPTSYYDWYRKIFELRGKTPPLGFEEILDRRYRDALDLSKKFFDTRLLTDDPVEGAWNERGYFNILDGHHRATFLYCSGFRRIPMKIRTADYLTWRNDAQVKKICDSMTPLQAAECYSPILNPFFCNTPGFRDCCYKTRLDHILEFFSSYRFAGMKVLDVGANKCYYAQHFYREGAEVTALEPDPEHFRMGEQLNDLHYARINFLPHKFEEFDTDETYDFGIMLTVFYHFAKYENLRRVWLAKIDKFINKFILWESGDKPEAEKADIMSNTKFKHYSKLAATYGTGKVRELGVFSVCDIDKLLGRMSG